MQFKHIKALSIKRIYAERIMAGIKTIELRKRRIGMELGDLILLYETAPDSVIRGGFIADKTISLPVSQMWEKYHYMMGVEKDFYDSYFANCELAYGTLIYRTFTFPELSLNEIYQVCSGFTPPQATINWREDWYIHKEWINVLGEGRNELMQAGRLSNQLKLFPV
ncbi:ASCH domain-containing protein [Nostoc sp. CENA67]|uniref:ASCH domain-containing protein n=1 Tax=Amazonocrinis nigriterrae CENA67 TaxID=2794033 RepID=A0A8J7L825_9NOST|nr:ASCH domain-containing protein [Amazonocrinis nigriterrae]MBH8564019.1 ASCH domain-containing protein [Amazonocrinis nigriterrae CENA67]